MPGSTGGVAERLNAPVLKTGIRFGVSRVRIPPPPLPAMYAAFQQQAGTIAVMFARIIMLFIAMVLLGGCLPGSRPIAATVEVRDATTHDPVSGATVHISGGQPFVPHGKAIGPPISPWPAPRYSRQVTDEQGSVNVEIAGNRPNWLTVSDPRYTPTTILLRADATNVYGATSWTGDGSSKLEVRAASPQESR